MATTTHEIENHLGTFVITEVAPDDGPIAKIRVAYRWAKLHDHVVVIFKRDQFSGEEIIGVEVQSLGVVSSIIPESAFVEVERKAEALRIAVQYARDVIDGRSHLLTMSAESEAKGGDA